MSIIKIRKQWVARWKRWKQRMWGRWGIWLWLVPLVHLLFAATSRPNTAAKNTETTGKKAWVISVVGSINAGTADYIGETIRKAPSQGASVVVLEMDTPGGFLQATRNIVKSILNAELPVLVFVSPSGARAGSAGVFITLAGHIAAMSPGTNIGAAHPVTGGGKDPEASGGKHLAKKIENDTVAFVAAIAKQRHRNVAWARKAVLESDSVTSDEALSLKVIDLIAADTQDLLQKVDGRVVRVGQRDVRLHTRTLSIERKQMTLKQGVVNFFADPNIAYFLLTFGMLGIVMEIYHPGAIFPGVFGAICLFLSFVAMQVLPINYGGLALMGLGLLLLVAELFTPTFGVLFLGGLISLAVGSIFLIDSPDPNLRLSLYVIMPTLLAMALLLGGVLLAVLRTYRQPVFSGVGSLVGREGSAYSEIIQQGKVFIDGEIWNARAKGAISKGARVRVVAMDGLLLHVEPVQEKP